MTNFNSVCGGMLFPDIKTDLTLGEISEYLGHFNFKVKGEIEYDGKMFDTKFLTLHLRRESPAGSVDQPTVSSLSVAELDSGLHYTTNHKQNFQLFMS